MKFSNKLTIWILEIQKEQQCVIQRRNTIWIMSKASQKLNWANSQIITNVRSDRLTMTCQRLEGCWLAAVARLRGSKGVQEWDVRRRKRLPTVRVRLCGTAWEHERKGWEPREELTVRRLRGSEGVCSGTPEGESDYQPWGYDCTRLPESVRGEDESREKSQAAKVWRLSELAKYKLKTLKTLDNRSTVQSMVQLV